LSVASAGTRTERRNSRKNLLRLPTRMVRQAQCVIATSAPNYQEEQTHTWRMTVSRPWSAFARNWPAMWSVAEMAAAH